MNEIPFETLPQKFVVKTNHWSGNNVFCQNKNTFNREALNVLESQLQRKYGTNKVEWPYWHITPRVLVEEYLEDQYSRLIDYKFFCFNGQPRFLVVKRNRDPIAGISALRLYLDLNWKILPFLKVGFPKKELIPQPKSFDQMIENCRALCKGLPFVRVDFYDLFGECRFGELTLYPNSGCGLRFEPAEWNYIVGDWLTLPESKRNPQFAYGPSP